MGKRTGHVMYAENGSKMPRGFHLEWLYTEPDNQGPPGQTAVLYVRDGYEATRCSGEAHKNAHVDGCGVCLMGVWGWAPRKLSK